MIIIWGTKGFSKIMGWVGPYTCPSCGTAGQFGILRVIRFFTLFWIPLIPFSFKYYTVCPVCKELYPLPKQEAKQLIEQYQQYAGMQQ